MLNGMNIAGKSILVTGASQGLGAALARELADEGGRVALVAREPAALEALARELRNKGREAHAFAYDIGDKAAIYPLVGGVRATLGAIDVLVHNASTLGPTPLRLLLDTDCEDLSRVLEVNLLGPFRLTKAVAGAMALRSTGTIVHVSSDAAIAAYPAWGAYSVSKAALDHLSRSWAAELGAHGVRVFSVDPGEMDTRMHRAALPDADPSTLADPRDVARRIVSMIEAGDEIENGARLTAHAWRARS
jgi:NAD(P)-dependent dehydrogenase (short-subunit alcohol dehydrogenase family)